MPLETDTVFVPVSKGVDVTTEARLVQPPGLLEAINSCFPRGAATKRRGHQSYRLRNSTPLPANTAPVDSAWRLTKILGDTGVWDAAAYTNVCIPGNGYVEFTAYETITATGIVLGRVIGLSRTVSTVDRTDIEYGLLLTDVAGVPTCFKIESGVTGASVVFTPGSTFKIERVGTTVTYYVNGIVLAVSGVSSSGSLLVDSSFQAPNANVYNLRVVSGAVTQTLTWTKTGVWASNIAGWVYGVGQTTHDLCRGIDQMNLQHPEPGVTYGVAQRDDEALVWDGFNMVSYTPSSQANAGPTAQRTVPATMPALRAMPIAKNSRSQLIPDCADNGVIRVVAWIESSKFFYAVYDSVTGAAIVPPPSPTVAAGIGGLGTPSMVRAFSLGAWVHLMVLDTTNNKCNLFSIPESNPGNVTLRSYGTTDLQVFDIWKVDETLAVLVKGNANAVCNVSWIAENGSSHPSYPSLALNIGVMLVASPPIISRITCCINPASGNLHIAYCDDGQAAVWGTTYSPSGLQIGEPVTLQTAALLAQHITCAPRLMFTTDNKEMYDVYWDKPTPQLVITTPVTPAFNQVYRRQMKATGTLNAAITAYGYMIASRAFTVGDQTFLWTSHASLLQNTWTLLDRQLSSCGTMDFGAANPDTSTFTASVNFVGQTDLARTKFHLALPFRLRSPASSSTNGIFTEVSVKYVTLDFLPKLRSVQAGRSTYFAGAQMWSWDGNNLTEAQFLWGPELAFAPTAIVGGALSNPGTYSYRIDVCHKNGQNEEVRSLSIITASVSTSALNKSIAFYIPTIPTRRNDTYFLVYRNAVVAGTPLTNWWLMSSRDPASGAYIANDQAVPHRLFTDDGFVTDTTIQNNELHPATGDNYLQPVASPACEVISAGPDRLWVAGGELAPGTVAPSRLIEPGFAPSFNPYLNIVLDQENAPITAIAPFDDNTIIMKENRAYYQNGPGPNNSSGDSWGGKRLMAAGTGAQSQESVITTAEGVYCQSQSGIRLVSNVGDPTPVGHPVDELARTEVIRGVIQVPKDNELRWYCEDRVLVFNYLYNIWSTWDFGATGAIKVDTGAFVTRSDGNYWVEDEVYKDGDCLYTHRIRFPWLHAGQLGDFQRVKGVMGLGRYSTPHKVHMELFYDDRDFPEEYFDWSMPDTDSSNIDTWGAGTWGLGVWGNTLGTSGVLTDSTWDFLRKPARQKCAHISISIDDNNTDGAGFVLLGIELALARKPGPNRLQWRGGSDNFR
jgi:hypothetical protein